MDLVAGGGLWAPFGVGVVRYPMKDQRVELTMRQLRLRRARLPMDRANLPHVARLWLEGRSTADDQPVLDWTRRERVVWVPLEDGRARGVQFRDPAAFAEVLGAFAVAACGGPDIVRARVAAATYLDPLPMRPRPTANSSGPDLLDIFNRARSTQLTASSRRRRAHRVARPRP